MEHGDVRHAGTWVVGIVMIFGLAGAFFMASFDSSNPTTEVQNDTSTTTDRPDCSLMHYRLNINGIYYDFDPKTASLIPLNLSDNELKTLLESGVGCSSITFPGSDGNSYVGQPFLP